MRVSLARRVGTPGLLVVAAVAATAAFPVPAQVWQVTPTLGGRLTWTNNYDLQSNRLRESDLITTITPGVSIDYSGPRSFLRGFVNVPLIFYARHSDDNRARPAAALDGRIEVVRDFFFIEAQANVTQAYFSPFGSQPEDVESVSQNTYTSQTYRVTPYIQGRIGGDTTYLVRNANIWRNNSNASNEVVGDSLATSYVNELFGTINRQPRPLGWGADVARTEYRYSGRDSQVIELARARAVWQPGPQLQLFVSGGYERNQFALSESSGAIYGAGVNWRPTERTRLDASFEERFFGTSYNFLFEHRTPRSVWNVRAIRNTSDLPNFIGQLPAGAFVPGLLFDLFASRITDPLERARFVVDFMQDRGLPTVLTSPVDLYDPQIDIRETLVATLGLLGVRNTVFFSVYRSKTEEIDAPGLELPPISRARNNNTQVGATAVWSHQLGPRTSMTLSANARRTEASESVTDAHTDYYATRLSVTRTVSPNTTVFGGVRLAKADFAGQINDYTEAAVFVGFNHSFR